ncbi:putative MFS transporter [Microbacterium testaceum]|uniref:MFS transporter n=1 Tax=Microbacterium TaxID=33882 RepID=UPI00278AB8E5|nr:MULTISPECIES: MFS transporter [Microbacterium]MDQ1111617.1 putative MFS transporter [Microbacterium testaceum]MDQ1176521.1 putative MFS transporter [Microbacterium sp. SORGH_AS_0421]MDR6097848.1 putative MFS transporter [Microbacterium sp. SORGH_AS_0454]
MSTLRTGVSPLSRLDRFPRWGLSAISVLTIGLGMLFVQYDVFNINVSFVQTCAQIIGGCTPATADQFIGLPIFLSLVGYGIGALILGPMSDRFGRHRLLIIAMVITGLGSLFSTFAGDATSFSLSRLITGIGIGADLAIINVYVSEIAPRRMRGRYTSVLFFMAALGAALGIWLGLFLTTPLTPWPQGLPFALASDTFTAGWRWVYAVGAILAAFSIVLRIALPESPRWLASRGRDDEAAVVVERMEKLATRRHALLPASEGDSDTTEVTVGGTFSAVRELLTSRVYLRRLLVIGMAWLLGYITLYAFAGAFTSVLVRQGYAPAEAGIVSAVGLTGFILAAVVARSVVDRVERKWWMLIGGVITVVGALVVVGGGGATAATFLGAIVVFFGQNIWVPAQYALTAESFPTRFRTTAYALADSIGHVGGGLGVFLLVGIFSQFPLLGSLLGLIAFLIVGALVNLLAPRTRNRSLEEISA